MGDLKLGIWRLPVQVVMSNWSISASVVVKLNLRRKMLLHFRHLPRSPKCTSRDDRQHIQIKRFTVVSLAPASCCDKAGTGQRLSIDFTSGPIANVQRCFGAFGDAAIPVCRKYTLNICCEQHCGHRGASHLSVSIASFQCTAGRPIFIALVSMDR
jgi:hypothetical protein